MTNRIASMPEDDFGEERKQKARRKGDPLEGLTPVDLAKHGLPNDPVKLKTPLPASCFTFEVGDRVEVVGSRHRKGTVTELIRQWRTGPMYRVSIDGETLDEEPFWQHELEAER